jgi:chromosome segregation ATPase
MSEAIANLRTERDKAREDLGWMTGDRDHLKTEVDRLTKEHDAIRAVAYARGEDVERLKREMEREIESCRAGTAALVAQIRELLGVGPEMNILDQLRSSERVVFREGLETAAQYLDGLRGHSISTGTCLAVRLLQRGTKVPSALP